MNLKYYLLHYNPAKAAPRIEIEQIKIEGISVNRDLYPDLTPTSSPSTCISVSGRKLKKMKLKQTTTTKHVQHSRAKSTGEAVATCSFDPNHLNHQGRMVPRPRQPTGTRIEAF